MKSLETAFRLKYMTGAKIVLNESGNWQLQSSLCEDSPMSKMPALGRKLSERVSSEANHRASRGSRERGPQAIPDDRLPFARRAQVSEDHLRLPCVLQGQPFPKGQPEATWALAKGNNDLGDSRYIAGSRSPRPTTSRGRTRTGCTACPK